MNPSKVEKQQDIDVNNGCTKQYIIENTNEKIGENFDIDKEKIRKQLEAAKNVEERVKLFAKRTDSFWLEAIVSMLPVVWDLTPSIVSTCYLLIEWIRVWLSRKDCLKILWYQAADVLVWAVPIIWDIADFFFKGNKYSSKVFSKHLEKLKKVALEKWISQTEIDKMWNREKRFIDTMNRYENRKA